MKQINLHEKIIYLLFLYCITELCSIQIQAQEKKLYIKTKSGSNQIVELNAISKLTFSGDDLVLNYTDNATEHISITTISNISFGNYTTGYEALSFSEPLLTIYPNPATDYIRLSHIPEGEHQVEIYSITGIRILEHKLSNDKYGRSE